MDAKRELERIIQESKILKYIRKVENYFGIKKEKDFESLYKVISGEDKWIEDKIEELAQGILDAGFVRLEDVENKLVPYKIMKPIYYKKEKTIIYQEMTEKEKKELAAAICQAHPIRVKERK